MEDIKVMGVRGLPLIHAGDDIAALICEKITLKDGDILCSCLDHLVKSTRVYKKTCRYHGLGTGSTAGETER